MTALRIRKELDIEMTLDHCTEGYLIADEIAASGCPVILGPIGNFPQKPEVMQQRLSPAGLLRRAGVSVGMCVGAGLSEQDGFASITSTAASILGLDARIGSLAPGKDANLAIFNGNPIRDLWCRCVATVTEGQLIQHPHCEPQ